MADLREQLQSGLADRYRVEHKLGRGGMATVYLARDLRQDRPVALKVLHPELGYTIGADRFRREIRVAAQLQHPSILGILDSGETAATSEAGAGQLWFTMPLAEGENLASACSARTSSRPTRRSGSRARWPARWRTRTNTA